MSTEESEEQQVARAIEASLLEQQQHEEQMAALLFSHDAANGTGITLLPATYMPYIVVELLLNVLYCLTYIRHDREQHSGKPSLPTP